MFAKSPPSLLQAWWAIWEFYSQHEFRMPLKVGPEGWQPLWGLFLMLLFPLSPCPPAGVHWGCRMGGTSPFCATPVLRIATEPEIIAGLDSYPGLCVGECTAQLPPQGQDWDLWQRAGAAKAKIYPAGPATALWEASLVLQLRPDTPFLIPVGPSCQAECWRWVVTAP